jgi:asparagine synthase (glutamine-hydrolysing)
VVRLLETDYPQALERFIRMTGLPPHHMQSVLFAELFRLCEKERRYLVTAQFADALFGLDSLVRPAAVLRRWGWLPRLTSKTYLPQSIKPPRLRLAESWSSALAEPIASTRGVAARAACYTDFPFVERVFGAAAVMRRLARRLEYVLDVCPLIVPEKTSDPDAQIEAAHLVDYFCDDAVSIWRQSAMSHGGYLIAPFTHPDIIGSSLRFDRTERYYRGGEVKPALKTLLRRRLPVYDTGIPKLASGLPIRRFLDSGPLAHSDYFAPPEFFPRPPQLNRAAYPHWVAWGILTLSMWRALVTKDPFAPPVWLSRRYP